MHTSPNNINTIMKYVDKEIKSPCWIWIGALHANGYGKVTIDYRSWLTHRYFYEQLVGPIPKNLQIDHLCFNKACVNPEHLEAVTDKVNIQRSAARFTKCIRGHLLEGHNLYMTPDGRRQCRTCRNASAKKHYWGR